MLGHILETKEIERDLEELILSKTDGIPFYIEEFAKSLKDLKVIEKKDKYRLVTNIQDLTIPSSIQDVILARIDALPEGAREILQVGAVIEREFGYQLLQEVTNLDQNELLSRLSAVKDSELIYERGIFPDITYIFKHALTRQVVYDSTIKRRQTQLHRKTGLAIDLF